MNILPMRCVVIVVLSVCAAACGAPSDSPETMAVASTPDETTPHVAISDKATPDRATPDEVGSEYAGSDVCAECHSAEYEQWMGSHHQTAMQEAGPETVLGDFADNSFEYGGSVTRFSQEGMRFTVETDGPDGELAQYTVRYTFGVEPLQQYLLDMPGGRLQALSVSWDSRTRAKGGERWFHLRPGENVDHTDVLHWTRPSANWNYMCADCHSTGVEKNYDPDKRTYDTQYAEISVGCEACHGQGSEHVNWARSGSGENPLTGLSEQASQINLCAQCHSRRGQLAEGFSVDRQFLDHYMPVLLDEDLYHPDGQILDEVYVYGSFLQSRMHAEGVRCSHCHEPHSATIRSTGNGLCTQCHNEVGRADFPSLPGGDFDSPEHHFHPTGSTGAACVSCHMPDQTYMVVDDRRDHSFRIPRPDLSIELGVPNACNQCHTEQSPEWASTWINRWYGDERRAHFGRTFAQGRLARPEAEAALVEIASDDQQPAIVRATALSLLVNYGLYASARAIEKGLVDASPLIRIGALRGAQRWVAEDRWQAVRKLLQDDVLAVRVQAVRSLLEVVPDLDADARRILNPFIEGYLDTQQLVADTAEGQSDMAAAHLALGNVVAAEQALRTSMELNPQWIPARVNLADLYRATGRDLLAGKELEAALVIAGDTPEVVVANALWHVRQSNMEQALILLARAWKLAPDVPRYAYLYVVGLNSAGQPDRALVIADEFLSERTDPQLIEAAYAIARDAGMTDRMREYAEQLEGVR